MGFGQGQQGVVLTRIVLLPPSLPIFISQSHTHQVYTTSVTDIPPDLGPIKTEKTVLPEFQVILNVALDFFASFGKI